MANEMKTEHSKTKALFLRFDIQKPNRGKAKDRKGRTSKEFDDLPFLKRREPFNRFHDSPMEKSIAGRIQMVSHVQTTEEIVDL